MDRFRTVVGVLAFAYFTHWSLTAPVPLPRQSKSPSRSAVSPIPCSPCLIGVWRCQFEHQHTTAYLAANGDWAIDWGDRWTGRWSHVAHPNGSSTLTVDEGPGLGGSGCCWSVQLEPGQRRGKLVSGGEFALEVLK